MMSTGAGRSTKRRMKTRGRPKLNPIVTYVQGAWNASQYTTRVPHNAVEHRYRRILNAKLKRLRRAVPTLLQSHEGSSVGQPKPRKSMVIVAAINHTKVIEKERNALQKENDGSRGRCERKKRGVGLISE
jgi:hypothetical protein